MKVSVVCPTHDRPGQLARTVAGVLAQEHADLELLVVADGATEATLAVLHAARREDPRVRVLAVPRHGHPAPLRELALAHASGGAIAYVDDDDSWLPEHLTALLGVCDERRPVVVSGAEYRTPDGELLRRLDGPELAWHPEIATADPYAEPSRVLHLRGVPERVGGWRDRGAGLEDWDLWWRLTTAGVPFCPVASTTAQLTVAATSRRHAAPCGFFAPVRAVADEATADALVAALRTPDPRLLRATRDDLDLWDAALLADPRTVWPVGAPAPRPGAWADALALTATGAADLVAAQLRGGWHVAMPLWCAEPAHARAAERVLRRRQAHQLAALQDLAADRPRHLRASNERIPA